MTLSQLFGRVPNPGQYSVPDVSLPQGEPVMPIALTADELDRLYSLHEALADVDPTGMDANPFLSGMNQFFREAFGGSLQRPDERLTEEIEGVLNDFGADLGDREIGVVDASPDHQRTLYLFLTTCKGYHSAPYIRFSPDSEAVETLLTVHERIINQDVYLKHPMDVLG